MRMNDNDHNDSDGFVTAKSHRSKTKTKKNDETKQQKSHRYMSSSTPSSSTRFAGNKWAKPSAAASIGTSGAPVTTAAAAAVAAATTANASTSPFIQHQQLPQPQPQPKPPEESKPSVSLTMSSLFGITTRHNDNMEIGNNTRTADHTSHSTTGITTKEIWPGHTLLATSSLASLMEDYGTYDPNWMNVEPTDMDHDNDDNDVTESERRNGTFRSCTCISNVPDALLLFNQGHHLNHNITMDETNAPVGVDSPLDDFDNEQYQRQQLQHQQNQQQQEPQHEEEEEEHKTLPTDGINRLQLHGHAPIHVEFVSFGYRYGIPSEIRYYSTGNCYTQPLLPFDTRTALVPVPVYLSHIDGKAGIIKNTMLRWRPAPAMGVADSHRQRPNKQKSTDDNDHNTTTTGSSSSSNSNSKNCMNVREYVNGRVIPPVANAIVQAIDIGQHGYVSPITISIYIGSENGKHRSVVTAELSAVALRKILRTNTDNRFQCPVSVGCRHRDICLSSSSSHNKSTTAKKQKAFEDHDD
jgi:hypothetical protein